MDRSAPPTYAHNNYDRRHQAVYNRLASQMQEQEQQRRPSTHFASRSWHGPSSVSGRSGTSGVESHYQTTAQAAAAESHYRTTAQAAAAQPFASLMTPRTAAHGGMDYRTFAFYQRHPAAGRPVRASHAMPASHATASYAQQRQQHAKDQIAERGARALAASQRWRQEQLSVNCRAHGLSPVSPEWVGGTAGRRPISPPSRRPTAHDDALASRPNNWMPTCLTKEHATIASRSSVRPPDAGSGSSLPGNGTTRDEGGRFHVSALAAHTHTHTHMLSPSLTLTLCSKSHSHSLLPIAPRSQIMRHFQGGTPALERFRRGIPPGYSGSIPLHVEHNMPPQAYKPSQVASPPKAYTREGPALTPRGQRQPPSPRFGDAPMRRATRGGCAASGAATAAVVRI